MSCFLKYVEQIGAESAATEGIEPRINDRDNPHGWMDLHLAPVIQPKSRRVSIIPPKLPLGWKDAIARRIRGKSHRTSALHQRAEWERVVEYRRRIKLALTLVTVAATLILTDHVVATEQMPAVTKCIYLALYGVMTYFLASNFYKLIIGTWHTLRGGPAHNPWHPSQTAKDPRLDVKVAIVYPICDEDVPRVAAGIAATWASILRDHPEHAQSFDNFLLSDSRKLEYWIVEKSAVYQLRAKFPGGKFFYRRRAMNFNAKLGNLTDFCRRWGDQYDYMVVMDADSVMDGKALVSLLRMMEGNERIGILQTNPKPILRESVFGRMHQFAARLYGTVFSYSLQSVHMGHASYIGHNAMIRMRPFIQHCILPELSGPAPWGGKPLSHDIIESALMARAGYEVWFLPEIEGSYEEVPTNILGFLIRERRWMQGNLQHLRFLFLHGLRASYRETFLNGALGYTAAPLWAAFLIVSAYGIIHFLRDGVIGLSSFDTIGLPMTMLLVSSTVFLFMPRILAILLNIHRKHAERYGGKDKLLCSLLIETIFSLFFSPIIMVFVTRFFWLWAKRKTISWGTQQRDDVPLLWRDCHRHFGWVSGIGLASWGLISMEVLHVPTMRMMTLEAVSGGWVTPANILWCFFPVLAGLTGSVVIARITSLTVPALRRWRLFCTPEEIEPPPVVTDTITWECFFCKALPQIERSAEVLAFAVTDVDFYVCHRPETRQRPAVAAWLLPKVRSGQKLTERETLLALSERTCFDAVHVQHLIAKSVRQKPSAAEAA